MLIGSRIAMLVIALAALTPSPASAADGHSDVGVVLGDSNATVTIEVDHSRSTPGSGGSGTATTTRTGTQITCSFEGVEIDCRSSAGVWSAARQCYVSAIDPQPAPESPIWAGHDGGVAYQCTPPGATFSAGDGRGYWFWGPAAGSATAPELVDPVDLAEQAVERMELVAPRVGATPLDPDAPLLVGMDAWYWIDNDGEHAVGPITRSASAGATTVEATAHVVKTVWQTGDGATVTCSTAGTPWTTELGTGESPTCGHHYATTSVDEPDGVFTIRATTHWRVDWSGAGQSGVITFTMSGTRPLEVAELQVLQTH